MHHLDTSGRPAPSSLEVSRAAARRHEHLAALRDRRRSEAEAGRAGQPQHWFRVTLARLRTASWA